MLTVSRLAKVLGVTPDVIRHYTREGLLQPLVSSENGYRYFDATDAIALLNARVARSLDFSLKASQVFTAGSLKAQEALLAEREAELDREIEHLVEQKKRLREIRSFLSKTELCRRNVVEDVRRPAIHSLYTVSGMRGDEPADRTAFERIAEWTEHLPYTHISLSLPARELNDPDFHGLYGVRLGIGVTDAWLRVLRLDTTPPVETVPAGRFLIYYGITDDFFALTPDSVRPLLEKAAALGVRFLNDTTGRLLAIEETKEDPRYHYLIRVRIGD